MALRKDQLLQSVGSAIISCFPEIGYQFALAPWAETSQEKEESKHTMLWIVFPFSFLTQYNA